MIAYNGYILARSHNMATVSDKYANELDYSNLQVHLVCNYISYSLSGHTNMSLDNKEYMFCHWNDGYSGFINFS